MKNARKVERQSIEIDKKAKQQLGTLFRYHATRMLSPIQDLVEVEERQLDQAAEVKVKKN